jgi:hypothetical protein
MERVASETGSTFCGDAVSAHGEADSYIRMRHDTASLKSGMLKN